MSEAKVTAAVAEKKIREAATEVELAHDSKIEQEVQHKVVDLLEQYDLDLVILSEQEHGDLEKIALRLPELEQRFEEKFAKSWVLRSKDEVFYAAKLYRQLERSAKADLERLEAAKKRIRRRLKWATTMINRALEDWAANTERDTKSSIRLKEGARLQYRKIKARWKVKDDVSKTELLSEIKKKIGELEAVAKGIAKYELVIDDKGLKQALKDGDEEVTQLNCVEFQEEKEKITIYGL